MTEREITMKKEVQISEDWIKKNYSGFYHDLNLQHHAKVSRGGSPGNRLEWDFPPVPTPDMPAT
jgi:hypothetical protein